MKISELMDMTLREILEEFCVFRSLECDYVYGISSWENANKVYENFDSSDEPSFVCEHICETLVLEYLDDEDKELLEYSDLENVLKNIGLADKRILKPNEKVVDVQLQIDGIVLKDGESIENVLTEIEGIVNTIYPLKYEIIQEESYED